MEKFIFLSSPDVGSSPTISTKFEKFSHLWNKKSSDFINSLIAICDMFFSKSNFLFVILSIFFVSNVILAELIGVKIFSFEKTLGFPPVNWTILGVENISFQMTAGVILWPFVFLTTDIVNEFYGVKGVRILSFLSVGIIIYAFLMISLAIHLSPADFWLESKPGINMQKAFHSIFGQGLWIIIGSMVAFLIGQFVDVFTFRFLKRYTRGKSIWLRATGSTLVSQLIDSFVVLYIAFGIGADWSWSLIFSVCTLNYIYKFFSAILLTPLIYLVHYLIVCYLGENLAKEMIEKSM